MRMDPIEPTPTPAALSQTISDVLDRLEITVTRIGQLTAEQSFTFLRELDAVYERMQALEPANPSRKIADAQLANILAKLNQQAPRFLRDLGGAQALQRARAEGNPPREHAWWYLDQDLDRKHKAAARRLLVTAGVAVLLIAALAVLYNRYLAPDPRDMARYSHLESASQQLRNGDMQRALVEINQGLEIAPLDPELLILKGVVQEQLGQNAQAAQSFAAAQKGFAAPEEFYLTRGQAYMNSNQAEKALADTNAAIQANPQFAGAYLLRGQVYELQKKYQAAMADYNQAFTVADKAGQPELAAIARVRVAYLTQTMNVEGLPGLSPTSTPAP
jgi:Tfp pilus assembly protein PilF